MSRLHDQGEANIGNIYLRNQAHNANLFLGLYTNATQPIQADTMVQVTEVSGGGYARITLPPADWTQVGGQTGEGDTRFDQPQRTFTFTAGVGNVTGCFITTALTGTAGLLVTTEHFPVGVNINQTGFEVRITPRLEFR